MGLELEKTEWRGKKRKKRNILILKNNCTQYDLGNIYVCVCVCVCVCVYFNHSNLERLKVQ